MKLHKDKEAFNEVVTATSASLNIEEFQVEKDYYVSLLLKKLVEISPDIVFKGGTSLSKCYSVIDRFSEDIDINLKIEQIGETINRGKRKLFKKNVLKAIEEVGFNLLNDIVVPRVETRSGRDFNKYLAGYNKEYAGGEHMVDHIIVETSITYRAFPCENLEVSNYITKYLMQNDEMDIIERYELNPFTMQVQTIHRTFIDKIFAICDYFEDNVSHRYSRHIYDISMIWKSGLVDPIELDKLIPEIIEVRKPGKNTHSCKTGYRVIDTLEEIIEADFYKKDYETNTKEFLSKQVPYQEAIRSLDEIVKSGLIPEVIK